MALLHDLQPHHKRMAFMLTHEIQELAREFGIERLGFLTLTVPDKGGVEYEVLQKRFHSFWTHELSARYERAITVVERGSKYGRLHLHLLVVAKEKVDLRTGVNFLEFSRRVYSSAPACLKAEWRFFRNVASKYGFGRCELLPVKSSAEGIARYVGSYVKKGVEKRVEADKGRRIVRFAGYTRADSNGDKVSKRKGSTRFAWASSGSWLWRQKLKTYAQSIGVETMDQLREIFGHRWAYALADAVESCPPYEWYPDRETAEADGFSPGDVVEENGQVLVEPSVFKLKYKEFFKRLACAKLSCPEWEELRKRSASGGGCSGARSGSRSGD